jgi:hypothetical protein
VAAAATEATEPATIPEEASTSAKGKEPATEAAKVESPVDAKSPVAKEPETKKLKLSTTGNLEKETPAKEKASVQKSEPDSAVSVTAPSEDEWVEIDKSSIPQKVTVEDADED